MIKSIIFDLDGTVANTNMLIEASFHHTFKHYNISYTKQDILDAMGPTLYQTFSKYTDIEEKVLEMIKYYREFNQRNHDEMIRPFPGVSEGIRKLYEMGYTMSIVTSKTKELATRGLKVLGIDDCFSYVIGCDEVSMHKPNPEGMNLALSLMNTHEAIAVGDNVSDIEAAKNAFIKSVGVGWALKRDALLKSNPDYFVGTMDELLDILR